MLPTRTTPCPPSTGELVRRAADRDQTAWHELVHRYGGVVWTVARQHRLLGDDAADVAQATWLTLAQHLPRLRHPDRLAAWLATTARRESLRVVARRDRAAELVLAVVPVPAAEPEVATLAADRDQGLWTVLSTMSQRCRSLLRLIAFAPDLSYAQAARALGITVGSVSKTRARCLAVLRIRLAAAGVLDEVCR